MPQFSLQSQDIGSILSADTNYRIPIYQRDYRWGEAEAKELVEDVRAHEESVGNPLFLGTFIFQPDEANQATRVIDGQQRLTTLYLLLIAVRSRALEFADGDLATLIQQKITLIDQTTAQSRDCRLRASDSIRLIYEYMAKKGWDGDFPEKIDGQSVKKQINRVRPIYEVFRSEVKTFKDRAELSRFLGAIYDSFVISVSISNDDQALSIFERTNARGMNLEISDLLKNHLFSQNIENINDVWSEIVENSDSTIVRMLKYFYVSRSGYIKKPQLYRGLKSLAETLTPIGFTAELLQFSKFYFLTKNPTEEVTKQFFADVGLTRISGYQERASEIARSLAALREFGVVQFVPVAYAFVRAALRYINGAPNEKIRAETAAKQLVRVFSSFEKHHFVNNVICERVGNEVERLYADTCEKVEKSGELEGPTDDLIHALAERRASLEEFSARFIEISYSPSQLAIICYVFDKLNNKDVNPGQRLDLFITDKRLRKKSHNIEHFYPQSPRPEDFNESTLAKAHNIGNLLPLYFRDNCSLGNAPPVEKAMLLRGEMQENIQNLPFVQDFLKDFCPAGFVWDAEVIDRRARVLASQLFGIVGS